MIVRQPSTSVLPVARVYAEFASGAITPCGGHYAYARVLAMENVGWWMAGMARHAAPRQVMSVASVR